MTQTLLYGGAALLVIVVIIAIVDIVIETLFKDW